MCSIQGIVPEHVMESPRFNEQVLQQKPIVANRSDGNEGKSDDELNVFDVSLGVSCQRKQADWTFLDRGHLFGREEEVKALQNCLAQHLNTHERRRRELILVSGVSGIGKTVLVKKALSEMAVEDHHGHFILGKFDQLQQQTNEPYRAFVAAISQLVASLEQSFLEMGGGERRENLRTRILEEIGNEACRMLCALVPCFARLLDLTANNGLASSDDFLEEQEDQELGTMVARQDPQQDRLKTALARLLRVISYSSSEHQSPIVLVLDDLQWAEKQSLRLLESLIVMDDSTDTDSSGLGCIMIVGVCRSNEVPWEHNLADMLRRLEDEKATKITHIQVKNLSKSATKNLLADVLHQPLNTCGSLADILHKSSEEGNAFFMLQLLKSMLREGVLEASKDGVGVWLWHDDKWKSFLAHQRTGTEIEVVELVSHQIQSLPGACQQLLTAAACIGAEVEYDVLVTVASVFCTVDNITDNCNDTVRSLLEIAVKEGIMVEQLPHSPGHFAFSHDRMQQAAYSLLSEDERAWRHMEIGRALLQNLSSDELEGAYLFLVTNQLIHGIPLLTTDIDKTGLAQLCCKSGKKAARSCDFGTAQCYFRIGVGLLPMRPWKDEYHICLELHNSKAEAESCAADFEGMDATVEEIIQNARSLTHKIRAYSAKIFSLGNRSRFSEAIDVALEVLGSLGQRFPPRSKAGLTHIIPALLKTKWRLRSLSDSDILNLPDMDVQDHKTMALAAILDAVAAYSFLSAPDLFVLLVLRSINLALKRGIRDISCTAFAYFGILLIAIDEPLEGARFCELALKLATRFPAGKNCIPRVTVIAYGMVIPWTTPLRSTLPKLDFCVSAAPDAGDLECETFSAYIRVTNAYAAGDELPVLSQKIKEAMTLSFCNGPWMALSLLEHDFYSILMGTSDHQTFELPKLDEEALCGKHEFEMYTCTAVAIDAQLAYHVGNLKFAWQSIKAARGYEEVGKPSIYYLLVYIYHGMIALEVAHRYPLHRWQQIWVARRVMKVLKRRAKASPQNVQHKIFLLKGELEAVAKRNPTKAVAMFEKAAAQANAEGMMQLHALAYERAAIAMYRLQGKDPIAVAEAGLKMKTAIDLYCAWGANAVAAHLRASWKDKLELE